MGAIGFLHDDGGRAAAGFPDRLLARNLRGDCAVRALAIATERPYREVHDALARLMAECTLARRRELGVPDDHPAMHSAHADPDEGVPPHVTHRYLEQLGWQGTRNRIGRPGDEWFATLADLPPGRYVIEFRGPSGGHLAAFVDGVLRDIADNRESAMFGWWTKDPQRPRRRKSCPPPRRRR